MNLGFKVCRKLLILRIEGVHVPDENWRQAGLRKKHKNPQHFRRWFLGGGCNLSLFQPAS